MSLIEIAKEITRKYKTNINSNPIVESKNKYYLENHSFRLYSGVQELIERIKNKRKLIAIISASPREKLERTVPEEFLRKFDTIISGDDVQNGKPNPEPYLKAMDGLSLKPEQCIVIENAPLGIQSAKSAGIYCIAVASTLGQEHLKQADKIILNIRELIKFLC